MPAPPDVDDPAPNWQVPGEAAHEGLANLVTPLVRLEAFVVGSDGTLWHTWQVSQGGQ
jgi:hypothetical protein